MSTSRIPPEGVVNLPERTLVGRTDTGTGEAKAVTFDEVASAPRGKTYGQAELEALLGSGGPGPSDPFYEAGADDYTRYHVVDLEAGATYEVESFQHPRIFDWTFLTTDPANPATIKFKYPVPEAQRSMLLAVLGSNIVIENIKFDWNFGPLWFGSGVCIKFAAAGGTPEDPSTKRENITLRNLEFIDSDPPQDRDNAPIDNWCINIDHHLGQPARNIQIINCRHIGFVHAHGWTQLTSGGNGGVNGLVVRDCFISRTVAGGIQFTSSNVDADNPDVFENVQITDNVLYRVGGTSISLGPDGSEPEFATSLRNVVIARNFIDLEGNAQFTSGPRMKAAGPNGCFIENCAIVDNTIVQLNAEAVGCSPSATLVIQTEPGLTDTPADVLIKGNVVIGAGPSMPWTDGTKQHSARRQDAARSLDAFTIGDKLIINDLPNSPALNDTENAAIPALWRHGNGVCVNSDFPEPSSVLTAFGNPKVRVWERYYTIDARGLYAGRVYEIEWIKTDGFIVANYPSQGQLLFIAASYQPTASTWLVEGGNVFWADGAPPDLTDGGLILPLARVLITWRYDGTDIYASYDVMS